LPNVQVWIRQYLEDGLFEKLVFTDANEGETLGTFSCFVPSLEAEVIVGTALEEIELSSGSVRQSSRSARAASSRRGTPGGSASIELTLRETDTVLAGTVLDTSTGKGVKGAFVYAYSGDGQNASGVTADDSGAFQLKVARAGEGEGDSNIWSVSATWEPSDSSIYYRSSTETIDISGTDYTVTVPELSLEASGTPASAEVYEFSSASGGNCLLSGAGTASGGKKQDSAAQAQGLTGAEIPANVISAGQAQTLKITVDPQTQGLPETATDQLVGPGYAVAMYSKETGKKFDSDLNKEITLTFSYTDEQFSGRGIGETNIRPAYFLEASGSWQPVKNFTIDTEKNTVTFRTDHLSVWALTAPRAGEAEPGDVNNDRFPGKMNDAILALQVCAGSGASAYKAADMNGDGKIGLAEAISILRNLSGK
jgi:hypothetical protein